jgi:lipoteichoic acid synthase
MRPRGDTENASGGAPRLLDHRDWVYVLALLVPFALYNLALKGVRVASLPDEHGLLGSVQLMRSDLLFDSGYALLWVGLFALARGGLLRAVVVGLFHAVTIFVTLVETGAYQFYEVTGSTLNFDAVLYLLLSPREVGTVAASEATPALVALMAGGLYYVFFGPLVITRLVGRWRGWEDAGEVASGSRTASSAESGRRAWFAFVGSIAAACVLVALSLLPAGGPAGASESFSRDAFVNAALTGVEEAENSRSVDAGAVRARLPLGARLSPEGSPAAQPDKRNVVVIHLESAGARSMTPYNEDLKTTTFLDELSKRSLRADRAYAVVPHTTNALVATLCGIEPPIGRWQTYSLGDRIPSQCLPELLGGQGYRSVYFTSSEKTFERRPEVVKNMGYDEFYPLETMDKRGFEEANYFGYEDDIMLGPSKEWLEKNGDKGPILATYETITPHHDYLAPDRYGIKDFTKRDGYNRYLNSVRYVDYFVKNLIQQYKELGLYKNTIFVIYGDHGEAFGEHGRYQHDNVPYEEGLHVPMFIHDPKRWQSGERVRGLVSQLDVLPSVVDLLGYKVVGADYPGRSLLRPIPENRSLKASCWYEEACLASMRGDEKYIYYYGDRSEQLFDLSKDPSEEDNLAGQLSTKASKERRVALLRWAARVKAAYEIPGGGN